MYESLHNHTVISDGCQTHLEVLKSAEQYGFGVIAFTDHDVFPSQATLKHLREYDGPVKWLVGIELSCGLPTDLGGKAAGSLHVLGYFCDPAEPELASYLARLQTGRFERMRRQIEHINSLGFELTEAAVLAVAGISAPGSFHVVKALSAIPANLDLIEKYRLQMEAAAQTDPQLKSRYDKMMATGPVQYPYALFMQSSSYLPMAKHEAANVMADMDEAVSLIRGAGGVAMLAHWYFHEDKFPRAALEAALSAGRLDGIETAVFNSQNGEANNSASIDYLTALATSGNYARVMGIDGHYEADFDVFVTSGQADESVGQTKALIKRFRPSNK